jgi:glutathione S-transferase
VLDAFSVCDLHPLVFLLWRATPALAGKLPVFANLDALQQRLFTRPGLAAIVGEDMKLRMDS